MVIINVASTNAAPLASDDEASTPAGRHVDINVLANDSDPEGEPLHSLLETNPANGIASCEGAICSYEPHPGFSGIDSFTYLAIDPVGAVSSARVTVVVTPCPVAPLATHPGEAISGTSVTLRWSDVGAEQYDIFFGREGTGCSTILGSRTEAAIDVSDLSEGTYEWRVEARNASCLPVSSACARFEVTREEEARSVWLVPGVGDLRSGTVQWRSDLRMSNLANTPLTATVWFYPEGNPAARTYVDVSLPADSTVVWKRFVATNLGVTDVVGIARIEAPKGASLDVSAKTYAELPDGGTFGQSIASFPLESARGASDRPARLAGLEETPAFRTNIGIAEVAGNEVTLQITASSGGATRELTLTLMPNEFRQIGALLRQVGLAPAADAVVQIRIVSGKGRIIAYASIVDNVTNDPTFVPAH